MVFLKNLSFEPFNRSSSILIYYEKENSDIIIINIYVYDFLVALKYCKSLNWIKKCFKNKYNMKNLKEVKTIIS